MKGFHKNAFTLAAAIAMISGCSTQLQKESRSQIDEASVFTATQIEAQKNDAKPAYRIVDDRYFLGSKVMSERKEVPDQLRREIPMSSKAPQNILAIADRFSGVSGIPVRVEPDVLDELEEQDDSGSGAAPALAAFAAPPAFSGKDKDSEEILSLPPIMPVVAKLSEITYSHNGPLSEFLDMVAARMDIDWRFDKIRKEVVFYRYEVKSWKLEFLAEGYSSSLGSSGSTDDESGSEGVSTSYSVDASKRYDAFQAGLAPLMSKQASVNIDKTSGTLTIKDRRSNISKIDRFVKDQNTAYNRQVLLSIKIVSVEDSRSHGYNLDWSAMYGGSNVDVSSVNTSPGSIENGLDFLTTIVRPTSPFNASTINVEALTAHDGISLMYSESVRTLSGRSVPFNAVTEVTYLARVSTSVDANGSASTTLEPDTLTTGLTLLATPLVTDNNEILLSMSLDVSTLVRMDQVSSGGQSISTPEVSRQRHSQEIRIPAGASVVVHGYELNSTSSYEHGIGSKFFKLLGGGSSNEIKKGRVALIVTPIIIN